MQNLGLGVGFVISLLVLWNQDMDLLETLLDWSTDNLLQATLIHTHLEDHELEEVA